ncbi:MAG: aminoacetone oxidase family FAD-binding enzyme [Patescibacteria group bacterium]
MKEAWDVVVIGGGPAGMMAAGTAAKELKNKGRASPVDSLRPRVLLLEKNDSLGKKLLITGGGRSNITNEEFDTRALLKKFKESEQFLFSAFSQFAVTHALEFFHGRGMETKTEKLQRVFPLSNTARSVWETLVAYMKESGVEVKSRSPIDDFIVEDKKIVGVRLKNKKEIFAKHIILATGGFSHPETGSTGDGFEILKKIGHTVVPPSMALVPITTSDAWGHKIPGAAMSAKITLFQNSEKQYVSEGRVLFTHQGLSGPGILNASSEVGELLKYGEVELQLDIVPHLSYDTLNFKLQDIFKTHSNKKLKNALSDVAPGGLLVGLEELSGISFETACNSVTREQRLALVKLFKHIPLHPTGLLGEDKAIITSGGVVLEEIDFKTMQSRLYPNLYIVGDLLNIDRPSGGYSLQLCWTTGFVAGKAAADITLTNTLK